MSGQSKPGMKRAVTPKDVFARSNMPSWWERLTGVAPKIDADRKFLAFVAARYRGEPRLPSPTDIVAPVSLLVRTIATMLASAGVAFVVIGVFTGGGIAIAGAMLLAGALLALCAVEAIAGPEIRRYRDLHTRAVVAQSRLGSKWLDDEDAETLNNMICCDEGTLTYCAAKIASEIERSPAWGPDAIGFVEIDLWDELAEIGASARRIALDREATEELERGRLRDDHDIRSMINEDKQIRRKAIAALAARVHALADYRDRVQRCSARELRDRGALDRAVRLVCDEQARNRLG